MGVIPETTKRGHQLGEARPPKAAQSTVLEPADDRLVNATEAFEASLRETKVLASSKHKAADQHEPALGLRVRRFRTERLPHHRRRVTGTTYPAISGMSEHPSGMRGEQQLRAQMQLACITRELPRWQASLVRRRVPAAKHVACISLGVVPRLAVPGQRSMQASCIAKRGSTWPALIGLGTTPVSGAAVHGAP